MSTGPSRGELDAAVNEANRMIGRVEQSQINLDNLNSEISSLQDSLSQLQDRDKITRAAEFIKVWQGASDADAVMAKIQSMISVSGCQETRIISGNSSPEKTIWRQYKSSEYGAWTEVNTSSAGFSKTPQYFASLGGDGGHWSAVGTSSIYQPQSKSFRIYVRWHDNDTRGSISKYAENASWHVNWVAIGC